MNPLTTYPAHQPAHYLSVRDGESNTYNDSTKPGGCEGWTTRKLARTLNCVRERNLFLFNNIFTRVERFDTEEIQFDRVYDDDQMIPFVCPCDQAPIMDTSRGFDSIIFRPAYVKAKTILNCCEPMQRMPGEHCWGELTEVQRFNMKVTEQMRMLNRAVDLREERMMWDALIHGKYTVEGENYPAQLVDFKRDKELNKESLCFTWDKESCDILGDFQKVYDEIMCRSGAMVTHILAGPKACLAIKNNAQIQKLFCGCSGGGRRLADVSFDITPKARPFGARPEISIGSVDVWCITSFWKCKGDHEYTKRPFLPDDCIIFLALGNGDCDLLPTRLYGAIRDCKSLRPVDRFVKMKEEWDPSAYIQMIQAAPLPVIINANASAAGTVKC